MQRERGTSTGYYVVSHDGVVLFKATCLGVDQVEAQSWRKLRGKPLMAFRALTLQVCLYLSGMALPTPVPPSACIPAAAPWSDLIVARVYACVVGQGGVMDGQETETE